MKKNTQEEKVVKSWNFDELYIVGYYGVVGVEHTPCPVPPIFGIAGQPELVVIPLDEEGDQLTGWTESREEFKILIQEGEATAITDSYMTDPSLAARPGYRLCVIEPGKLMYVPRWKIDCLLDELADQYLNAVSSILSLHQILAEGEQELIEKYLWRVMRARPGWAVGYLLLRRYLEGERAQIFEDRFQKKFPDKEVVEQQIKDAGEKNWMTDLVRAFLWDGLNSILDVRRLKTSENYSIKPRAKTA